MSKAEIIIPFPLTSNPQELGHVEAFAIGNKLYNVTIPPNTRIGQKLRLKGIASELHPSLKNDDLLLYVLPPGHMIYHVKRDIYLEMPLTHNHLEKGIVQRVNLEDRKFDIKVPAGTAFGKKLRMGDLAYICNGGYPGDIFLKVVPANRPKRRFFSVFGDFSTLIGGKLTVKIGVLGLFEVSREWQFSSTPAELRLGK